MITIELSDDEVDMLIHMLKSKQSIAEATPTVNSILSKIRNQITDKMFSKPSATERILDKLKDYGVK
ncbi:hypothetical protein LCGC14_1438770 [marine sediment metagenome]|uniref:Uncharacterized protein n=1 Tax=marine sediment metagenome TaxID=412755 RepID=A0A0F9JLA7_9ZZZZ